MKESSQKSQTIENEHDEQKTVLVRKAKKALTLSQEAVLNKYASFEKYSGLTLSLKGTLSTEESEFLNSHSVSKKKEEQAKEPPKKLLKKMKKVIEISLGPRARALVDQVVVEEVVLEAEEKKSENDNAKKKIGSLKEERNTKVNEKVDFHLEKENDAINPTKKQNYKQMHSWADGVMSNLKKVKSVGNIEIKSFQNLEMTMDTHKSEKNPWEEHSKSIYEINKDRLEKINKDRLEKKNTSFVENSTESPKSFLRRRKTNTSLLQSIHQNSHQKTKRIKNFRIKYISNVNLFEGLPYIGYEAYLKKDLMMQKIIIKDLLKVLFEKCLTLKNSVGDRFRTQQVERMTKN